MLLLHFKTPTIYRKIQTRLTQQLIIIINHFMEIQQSSIIVINEQKEPDTSLLAFIFYSPYATIGLFCVIIAYYVLNLFAKKKVEELQVPKISLFDEEAVERSLDKVRDMTKIKDPIKVLERYQETSREQSAKNVKKVSKIDLFTQCHKMFKKINKQSQLYRLKMEEEQKEEKRKEGEKQKQKEAERIKNEQAANKTRYKFGEEEDRSDQEYQNSPEEEKAESEANRSSNRKLTIEKYINNSNDPIKADLPKKKQISSLADLSGKTITGEGINPLNKPSFNKFSSGGFFNQSSTNLANKSEPPKPPTTLNQLNQQSQPNKTPIDKSKPLFTQNQSDKNQASASSSNQPSFFSSTNATKKEEPKVSQGLFSQNPLSFGQIGQGISIGVDSSKSATSFSNMGLASFATLPIFTQPPKKSLNELPPFTSNPQTSTSPAPTLVPNLPSTNPISNPVSSPSAPANRPSAPSPPANQRLQLTSEQYLETIIKFAESMSITTEITTTMSNLGGARSNINDLLIFSKSFINSINKQDDKQITTFALKVYNSIVHTLIAQSNVKDGLERMPPKSKTSQVEKSSITCYIIIVNFYRMMGYEKVWTIIFGKTLKLLQFIYTRKEDLKSYKDLDLIKNKYIELKGDIAGRYLSRMDFLTFFLFGLTSFDPHLIFSQLQHKDASLRKSREEIESWNYKWNYKEFWMLTDVFFRNKHESYFKPIIYINLLSVLFSRVYEHKRNPTVFKEENDLYKITLDLGKQFFTKYSTNKEIAVLGKDDEGTHERYHFSYDGEDFTDAGIKVLEIRLGVEKLGEFRLGPKDFDTKANVFYYFLKEKQ